MWRGAWCVAGCDEGYDAGCGGALLGVGDVKRGEVWWYESWGGVSRGAVVLCGVLWGVTWRVWLRYSG